MTTIVDTTVFTDALLKSNTQATLAKAAINKSFSPTLPAYAIKEFKQGPLHYYVWYHNKIVEAASWGEAVSVIQSNLAYRKNLPSTALQALGEFQDSIGKHLPSYFAVAYPNMTMGEAQLHELRLWLKQLIFRAWRARRKLIPYVISELPCYAEGDIKQKTSGQLDDSPTRCKVDDCCLRGKYNKRLAELRALEDACKNNPKGEVQKRRRALERLATHPTKPYEEKHCRALGDAVFVLECPQGGEVLTTNVVDHQPLADALNIAVITP